MRTLKNSPSVYKREAGFTLFETAIAMLVLGVLLAAAVLPYSLYLKRRAVETTQSNVSLITTAVGNYRLLNGFYPCPAPLSLPRTDLAYGHASTDCVTPALPVGNCAAGMAAGGICIQQSARTFTYTPAPPTAAPPPENPRVAVGAVPFRELNLDEDQMVDGYGNRIFYAVTEREATPTYFQPDGGGIAVLNDSGAAAAPLLPAGSALAIPASAHFIVLSAGHDAAGAYSRDGVLVQACPAVGKEAENCARGALAVYRSAQTGTRPGVNYYDDSLSYFTTADMPLWQYSSVDASNVYEKPGGNVGAKFSSQTALSTTLPLTAKGRSQSSGVAYISGDLMSQNLCNPNNLDCFATSFISGAPVSGTNTCPAGQFLKSISSGVVTCTDEIYFECGTNSAGVQKVMTGIQADGTAQCADYSAPPPPCPALLDKLCAPNDVSHLGAANGYSFTATAGASRSRLYTCTNGSWVTGATTGSCSCTPSVTATLSSCGVGFIGNKTTTVTKICPAGTVTVTVDASACVCVGATQSISATCPPPLTGSYTQTSTLSCPAGTFGAYLPSSPPAGACTCTPVTQTITNSCPGNLDGTWQQSRDLLCPTGVYTPYSPATAPPSACTCNSAKTNSGVDSCPPATPVGTGIPWTQSLSCPSGSWGPKIYGTPDCQPAPPIICHWTNTASGSSSSSGVGPSVGSTCACGGTGRCSTQLGTHSFVNYNGCVCE